MRPGGSEPDVALRRVTDARRATRTVQTTRRLERRTYDWFKIYVGTPGVDDIDDLLASNPAPYATGQSPGPVPYNGTSTVDPDGRFEPVWFARDNNGEILIGGHPVGGAAGASIFTLPVGWRPDFVAEWSSFDSAGRVTVGGWVDTDGQVYISAQTSFDGTPLSGDLTGTLPNPTVAKINGSPLGTISPSTNQALLWNGSAWVPTTIAEAQLALSDITTDNVTSSAHGFAPKSPADATKFLNGAATPAYAQVKDSDLSTTDITTNDVTSSKHGFAPKLPNDNTKFLDGTGNYSVPPVINGAGSVTAINMGTATATYTAASTSNTVTVNHGLGATPDLIVMQALDQVGFNVPQVKSGAGSTSFQFFIRDPTGISRTGSVSVYWLAIKH